MSDIIREIEAEQLKEKVDQSFPPSANNRRIRCFPTVPKKVKRTTTEVIALSHSYLASFTFAFLPIRPLK